MDGTILHAELRDKRGDWKRSSIDIEEGLDMWAAYDTYGTKFYDEDTDYYQKWSEQMVQAKLSARGWIVQERLLAPRVVYFAREQLFWECAQVQALEERPHLAVDNRQATAVTLKLDRKSWDLQSTSFMDMPASRNLGLNYI